MLTKLRIKNFKAWRDTGTLRLAPLTVLFGANSAGKTSLLQLLLLLKQTAESPDRKRPLQLGDEKKLVDLGTFEEILHGHDLKASLDFDIEFTVPSTLKVTDPLSNQQYEGDRIAFSARIGADIQEQPRVSEIRYSLRTDDRDVLDVTLREQEKADSRSKHEFQLDSASYQLVRHPERSWSLPKPVRYYGFPEEVTAFYQNAAFTADLVLAFEQMLRIIYYIGPLREYPRRLYIWSGETPDHAGARGEHAVEAILASRDRTFDWPGQNKLSLQALIGERLKTMAQNQDFEVKPLSTARKVYEVLLSTSPKLPKVNLTAVGFGLSQILPVIVECFYVPANSTVIFEQPEIHLHPKVQADLADLFVDAVRAREEGRERRCQFIIESHSEHFLRRLLRRVAEEKLAPHQVAIYSTRIEDGEAKIEELYVDEFGYVRNWPENFFGDEMADLVARKVAQAGRRAKANNP